MTNSSQKTLHVTNKSVEQAGIPKSLSLALSEYIWNGFDAAASEVQLKYEKSAIGGIIEFSIIDDGVGITYKILIKHLAFY